MLMQQEVHWRFPSKGSLVQVRMLPCQHRDEVDLSLLLQAALFGGEGGLVQPIYMEPAHCLLQVALFGRGRTGTVYLFKASTLPVAGSPVRVREEMRVGPGSGTEEVKVVVKAVRELVLDSINVAWLRWLTATSCRKCAPWSG